MRLQGTGAFFAALAVIVALLPGWFEGGSSRVTEASCGLKYLTAPRLDEGHIGKLYHERLQASGSRNGRYFWQLTAGDLPPGLEITLGFRRGTAVVRGTPTEPGHYKFTNVLYDDEPGYLDCPTEREFFIGVPAADVRVAQSAAPDPVEAGDLLTIEVGVLNDGPDNAEHVRLFDALPVDTQFEGAELTGAPGTCEFLGGAVDCRIALLRRGRGAVVTVMLTTLRPGKVLNRARASSATYDPLPLNNRSDLEIKIGRPLADLGVSLAGPASATVGATVRYRATATNHGPGNAVEVVAYFPVSLADVDYVRVNGRACHGDVMTTFPSCRLGILAPLQSITVVMGVSFNRAGARFGSVYVNTASEDPVPANDHDQVDTQVAK